MKNENAFKKFSLSPQQHDMIHKIAEQGGTVTFRDCFWHINGIPLHTATFKAIARRGVFGATASSSKKRKLLPSLIRAATATK